MTIISIGIPFEPESSFCGYCSSSETSSKSGSLHASQLSCDVYQRMIDRGWRRSGMYCYKPDLRRSCCPQYTIRLDALEFKPSKSQRKAINRWNRFVTQGTSDGNLTANSVHPRASPSDTVSFSLVSSIHASEADFLHQHEASHHRFQVKLEPSSYTQEKFELFRHYQLRIHQDIVTSSRQFSRFLVESPLRGESIPYSSAPPDHLPLRYGSYHQLYRLDDKLIAMSVIDILPICVSSVYFMYDIAWEKFSFGKLGAFREVSLAREMHDAGAPGMGWLYMGFYIHSCPKMRYKGDYHPSYLADPETYSWYPLKDCTLQLDKYRYAMFSNPHHSIEGDFSWNEDTTESDPSIPDEVLNDVLVVESINQNQVTVAPILSSDLWNDKDVRSRVESCVHSLGFELAKEIILDF